MYILLIVHYSLLYLWLLQNIFYKSINMWQLRCNTDCWVHFTWYSVLYWFNNNIKRLTFFFAWWRAPQQMLRTHRSLKASCATPVMKMSSFFYQVLQVMEHQWNEIYRGKPTTRRKTCPSATLSTTNLTWTDPGSNPGLRGKRPATNRLSHGTAQRLTLVMDIVRTFLEVGTV
jgi:hypothetical protein